MLRSGRRERVVLPVALDPDGANVVRPDAISTADRSASRSVLDRSSSSTRIELRTLRGRYTASSPIRQAASADVRARIWMTAFRPLTDSRNEAPFCKGRTSCQIGRVAHCPGPAPVSTVHHGVARALNLRPECVLARAEPMHKQNRRTVHQVAAHLWAKSPAVLSTGIP